jgi:hypothetical protein
MTRIRVNGQPPAPYVASLAEFKRWLAAPGATLQITHHWRGWGDWMTEARRTAFFGPRTVAKLQSKSVQFSDGSWIDFGAAADWQWRGDEAEVACFGDPQRTIRYKLSGGVG